MSVDIHWLLWFVLDIHWLLWLVVGVRLWLQLFTDSFDGVIRAIICCVRQKLLGIFFRART